MNLVTELLAHEADAAGFRAAARRLVAAGVPPDGVAWTVRARDAGLFDDDDAAPPAAARREVRVPASFVELCEHAALHRDPQRFHLLYRLLWRLQREPALRHDPLDDDWQQAARWAQAVRRDIHKMHAFVRFRPVGEAGGWHVAWFEPLHHTLEAGAPFFMRRFANLRWAILTPERSARWDGERLDFGPGATRADAPAADGGEALWLTYYAHIFNPARLKLKAMEKEMPRAYWKNLPEAVLISPLAAAAAERSGRMVERAATVPARRLPRIAVAPASPLPEDGRERAWARLRDAARACRECPLGATATQTVWGEGPVGARLMLVGEQPGDREDLEGRPFVGPAGQLLDRAFADLGWDRSIAYVTNVVKHFKYEPRGQRRIHKTPAQREADACAHWLESEIVQVKPEALVALGATAAHQLLGRPVAVTQARGQWFVRADGRRVLVTLHPSALLRAEPAEREAGYAAWLADLRQADGAAACALHGAVEAGAAGVSRPAASGTPAPRARAARGT